MSFDYQKAFKATPEKKFAPHDKSAPLKNNVFTTPPNIGKKTPDIKSPLSKLPGESPLRGNDGLNIVPPQKSKDAVAKYRFSPGQQLDSTLNKRDSTGKNVKQGKMTVNLKKISRKFSSLFNSVSTQEYFILFCILIILSYSGTLYFCHDRRSTISSLLFGLTASFLFIAIFYFGFSVINMVYAHTLYFAQCFCFILLGHELIYLGLLDIFYTHQYMDMRFYQIWGFAIRLFLVGCESLIAFRVQQFKGKLVFIVNMVGMLFLFMAGEYVWFDIYVYKPEI